MGKIEMLYCTSLLALVGSGEQSGSSPRKFKLWNSQNQVNLLSLFFLFYYSSSYSITLILTFFD